MSKENQILTLRDNAKAELMQIKTLEDGLAHLNKIKTIETWVKAEKKDAELQVLVKEQSLRTKRILGQLLKEAKGSGELIAPTNTLKQNASVLDDAEDGGKRKTLKEIGISHDQSSEYQKLAGIPEGDFEAFIAEKKKNMDCALNELTTAGAMRLADALSPKDEKVSEKEEETTRLNKRAEAIIKEVNEMPVVYRLRIKQSIRK